MPVNYTDQLEKIAEDIAKRSVQAYSDVINGLMELTEGKSAQEASVILSEANVENLMALKLTAVYAAFDKGVIAMLENTFSSVVLSEDVLQGLLSEAKGYLSQTFINGTTSGMRQEIISGIVSGLEPSQVIANMKALGYDERHLQTIVQSGYNQYSNSMKNIMYDELPDDSMFVYIGAYDDRTRPDCEQKILTSPASKKKILGAYGNLNNEVWNCRHTWEEVSNDLEGQGFERKKL